MILFHDIIEVFELPQRTTFGKCSLLLKGLEGWGRGGVLIDGDDPWGGCMAGTEHLPEEALCSLRIPRRTQQEINRVTFGVDRTVKIVPRFLHLDVRLIDAVGVVRLGEMNSTPLVEFRGMALDPAEHRRMIDVEPTLQQEFFDITVAEGIAEIPSHPTQ